MIIRSTGSALRTGNNYPLQVSWQRTASLRNSHLITALVLTDHILAQDNEYGYNIVRDQLLNRAEVSKDNKKRQEEAAASIHQQLPGWLQKAVELSVQDKRSFHLAHGSPTNRTWLHTT